MLRVKSALILYCKPTSCSCPTCMLSFVMICNVAFCSIQKPSDLYAFKICFLTINMSTEKFGCTNRCSKRVDTPAGQNLRHRVSYSSVKCNVSSAEIKSDKDGTSRSFMSCRGHDNDILSMIHKLISAKNDAFFSAARSSTLFLV